MSRGVALRMARLTDDAEYEAGEASGNVPCARSDSGNDHAYKGLRTKCVPLGLPASMTKLRKQGQTTSIINASIQKLEESYGTERRMLCNRRYEDQDGVAFCVVAISFRCIEGV
ncbi:unnamed protein product [Protopolystoma xenopodis]|uniref:Uncharacterized protein n=1 Tax=Protopolystoma xenopodis TaxID=117903 RepID=A0A3S5FBY1_9PLAT|nr:unnamed protein product [Protopolystoma xenopodis]